MRDPHYRIEIDPVCGPVRWTRFIADNDRGDEDPSEPPRWSVHGTVLDPVTWNQPLHSVVFTHEVKL